MLRGYGVSLGPQEIQSGLGITIRSFNIYWKMVPYQSVCCTQRATRAHLDLQEGEAQGGSRDVNRGIKGSVFSVWGHGGQSRRQEAEP